MYESRRFSDFANLSSMNDSNPDFKYIIKSINQNTQNSRKMSEITPSPKTRSRYV